VRAQSGVPGLAKPYGVFEREGFVRARRRAIAWETVWSTAKYLNSVPKLFERLRQDHGAQIELLHDVHHRLSPIEAARLAANSSRTGSLGWRTRHRARTRRLSPDPRSLGDALAVGEVFKFDLGLEDAHPRTS